MVASQQSRRERHWQGRTLRRLHQPRRTTVAAAEGARYVPVRESSFPLVWPWQRRFYVIRLRGRYRKTPRHGKRSGWSLDEKEKNKKGPPFQRWEFQEELSWSESRFESPRYGRGPAHAGLWCGLHAVKVPELGNGVNAGTQTQVCANVCGLIEDAVSLDHVNPRQCERSCRREPSQKPVRRSTHALVQIRGGDVLDGAIDDHPRPTRPGTQEESAHWIAFGARSAEGSLNVLASPNPVE